MSPLRRWANSRAGGFESAGPTVDGREPFLGSLAEADAGASDPFPTAEPSNRVRTRLLRRLVAALNRLEARRARCARAGAGTR